MRLKKMKRKIINMTIHSFKKTRSLDPQKYNFTWLNSQERLSWDRITKTTNLLMAYKECLKIKGEESSKKS